MYDDDGDYAIKQQAAAAAAVMTMT